jgi:hypothetical protein
VLHSCRHGEQPPPLLFHFAVVSNQSTDGYSSEEAELTLYDEVEEEDEHESRPNHDWSKLLPIRRPVSRSNTPLAHGDTSK